MEERLTTDQAVAGSSPATDAFSNAYWDKGLSRESNPGPLAPEARIMPLDH